MASRAAAAAAVAVFAILLLSSLGHPAETGPECSECALLCARNCIAEVANTCRQYCENPTAARQSCERQVFEACTASSCCYGNCSRDCNTVAKEGCQYVRDTTIVCQTCTGGVLQYCIPNCCSNYNSSCVKKEHA